MEHALGISGKVLKWFSTYLAERTQCIKFGTSISHPKFLQYGVPQGSVLDPNISCVYTIPVGQIISRYGLEYHIYADDTQIYTPFDFKDPETPLHELESCITEIRHWMIKNHLKINDDKTEFLISDKAKKQPTNLFLQVGDHNVSPSSSAKNLGFVFDSHMSMEKQTTEICRSIHFNLR